MLSEIALEPPPDLLQADTLAVFIDGSFDAKSRSGGWAFVVMEGDIPMHAARGSGHGGSNNTFELMGALEALTWLDASTLKHPVVLWTDSAHVIEGCARWRSIWRTNGWKRIDPNPRTRRRRIPDAEYWWKLDELRNRNPNVTIAWCKAHSGIAGNERADALARGRAHALDLAAR